jgi:flagellar basal-body rod protein FlgF
MDRMIHTALNSMKNLYDQRFKMSNNLANVNVPGFRRDLPNEGGAHNLARDRASPRSFMLETGPAGFSSIQGTVNESGVDWDVAIVGDGYFLVQPAGGEIALSRRGDLHVNGDGLLVNGGEELVLGADLAPIAVPPHREVQIAETGEILIAPLDGEPGQFESIGVIGSTLAVGEKLVKSLDGRIRRPDGSVPAADQGARFVQGMLEAANVNPVEELVSSLEVQRQFEISVKFIGLAEDIDRAGAEVMRLPEG